MPYYKYRAKRGPDETVEETIQARTEEEVVATINQAGLVAIKIEQVPSLVSPNNERAFPKSSIKIKERLITIFSRQFSNLLKSGLPILRSLSIIKEQTPDNRFVDVITKLEEEVKRGKQLSQIMPSYPNVFNPLYIAMVKSGEESGELAEALSRISQYRQKQEEFFSKVRVAAAYPILMLVVGAATVISIMTFAMPRLIAIFSETSQELPLITKILIKVSNNLHDQGEWIGLTILLVFFILRRKSKTKTEELTFSLIKLHLPGLGNLVRKFEIIKFGRTFQLLCNSGIGVLRALKLSMPVVSNRIMRTELESIYERLSDGSSLALEFKNARQIPLFVANMIAVGEESGKIGEALGEITNFYEQEVDEALKIVACLLEPILILGIGLVVGFIVVAMILPVFQISLR
ncbi:MAG: type II secretion system F family protein [Candidatus Omnitrophota bacterium]|nr:type II secretion system F family protein [Candidatus Omnitrophota bacterium]